MNRIYLIRHALTAGNEQKRYVGRMDEPLSERGILSLRGRKAPPADVVAVSPLRRCLQTADILFPDRAHVVVRDFAECDFGDFEGKNYAELAKNADYAAWVQSGGVLPFPHGEEPAAFRKRCAQAFLRFVQGLREGQSAALVVHGGTVMSVLAAFDREKRDFYDYGLPNGQGISALWEGGCLTTEGFLWQNSCV